MQKLSLVFEKLSFWLTIFLLAFIPLFPKFRLMDVPGTFVKIRPEDLIISGTLLIWFFYLLTSKTLIPLLKDRISKIFILFFVIGLLSIYSGYFITHTISPHLALLHYFRRIEYMLMLPLAFTVIKSKSQLKTALIILSAVVLLVNLYAFGQKYFNLPLTSTTNSEFSKGLILYLTPGARVNSSFAGHYDLAVFLVMFLTIASALFFAFKKTLMKVWMIILIITSMVVLIMTAARLSFVAVVVGVFMSFMLLGRKKYITFFAIFVALLLIFPSQMRDRFISTVTINIFGAGERYVSPDVHQQESGDLNIPTLPRRLSTQSAVATSSAGQGQKVASDIAPGEPVDTTELGVYRSFEIRFNQEWPRAIRATIKNPFLGTGYSSLGLATDNDILRTLGEVGILGFIAFSLIIIEIFRRLWLMHKSHDPLIKLLSVGVMTMMVAFIVNSLFIDVFESSKIAILLWLIIGINLSMEKHQDA